MAVDWIGAEARFDSPDPGAAKEVVVRGLALTGADAGNYVLAGSLTTQAAIRRPEPPPSVTPGLDAPTPRAPSSEAPLADPSFPDGEIEPVTVPWVDEGAQPAPPPEETLPEEPMREEATGEEGPGGAAPGRATVFLRTADGTFAKAGQTDDVERFGLGSGESIVEDALNETPVAEIMSVVRPDDDAPAVILIVSVLPDGIVVVRVLGPMPPGIDEDAIVAAALRAVEVLEIDPSEVKAVVLQVE